MTSALTNVELWKRFRSIVALSFTSKSLSATGWSGAGSGLVKVAEPAEGILLFEESGTWRQDGGNELRFTNTFRWTIVNDRMRLEHLRYGPDKPVLLFEMSADADGVWRETSPHPCSADCYRATLRLEHGQVFITWRVQGHNRDEVIDYVYV